MDREEVIALVFNWFAARGRKHKWVTAWFNRKTAQLDGKAPVDLLNNGLYDELISFARNDMPVISRKVRA